MPRVIPRPREDFPNIGASALKAVGAAGGMDLDKLDEGWVKARKGDDRSTSS
jgi:hypothetical protein